MTPRQPAHGFLLPLLAALARHRRDEPVMMDEQEDDDLRYWSEVGQWQQLEDDNADQESATQQT